MSVALSYERIGSGAGTRHLSDSSFELFNRCLAIVPADTDDLLDHAFRLRYQVYCVERGFEDAADHPDGLEQDGDDVRSLHSLLIERSTGVPVGTVRLILPWPEKPLPVFRVVAPSQGQGLGLPASTTAEVSRFAVAKAFRPQLGNAWSGHAARNSAQRSGRGPTLQLLTFGLISAVVRMAALGGVTHIVGLMEPAFLRLLGRLGIAFHPLGELVEHHGLRQPGWAVMTRLIASIKNHHAELGEIISDTESQVPLNRSLQARLI